MHLRAHLRTRAGAGFASPNPLFMRYTPSADGKFVGQGGYGYRSIDAFVTAVGALSSGTVTSCAEFDTTLATVHTTMQTTAILEAGRRSLDAGGMCVRCVRVCTPYALFATVSTDRGVL